MPRARRSLRQLIAHIGDDTFVAGVTAYLKGHGVRQRRAREFLVAMSAAAGQDLSAWSRAWLETAGADVISTELGGVVLRRRQSSSRQTDHTFDIAGWSDGAEVFRVPLAITSDQTIDDALPRRHDIVIQTPATSVGHRRPRAGHDVRRLVRGLATVPDDQARSRGLGSSAASTGHGGSSTCARHLHGGRYAGAQ